MKTVFINESALNVLRESVLMDSLPEDILSAVSLKKTSLGKNPALPDVFDEEFLTRIIRTGFEKSRAELQKIGEINSVKETEPANVLNALIRKCQEIERLNKDALEKLCYNIVVDTFDVPEDSVELVISLVDGINGGETTINFTPTENSNDYEFADLVDAKSIRSEVYKRRLIDVLCMGAGMRLGQQVEQHEEELAAIGPELMNLYRQIISLNTYLLYTKEDVGMTEEDNKLMGIVEVTLGNDIKKTRIASQGTIFPVLLSETFKGLMELFAAHGLPDDRKRAEVVVGKSDYLKTEPWDMRLGPQLWDILSNGFTEQDPRLIPYIFSKIVRLPIPKFNEYFREVFAGTRRGRRATAKLTAHAKLDMNGEIGKNGNLKQISGKAIISDEIHLEEL